MWVCHNCETSNTDNSAYCEVCGMSPLPDPPWVCPECEALNDAKSKFCEICNYDPEKKIKEAPVLNIPVLPEIQTSWLIPGKIKEMILTGHGRKESRLKKILTDPALGVGMLIAGGAGPFIAAVSGLGPVFAVAGMGIFGTGFIHRLVFSGKYRVNVPPFLKDEFGIGPRTVSAGRIPEEILNLTFNHEHPLIVVQGASNKFYALHQETGHFLGAFQMAADNVKVVLSAGQFITQDRGLMSVRVIEETIWENIIYPSGEKMRMAQITHDGKIMAVLTSGFKLLVYRKSISGQNERGSYVPTTTGKMEFSITALAIHSKSGDVIWGTGSRRIYILRTAIGRQRKDFIRANSGVTVVGFHPVKDEFCAGTVDGEVIWGSGMGEPNRFFFPSEETIHALTFLSHERFLVAGLGNQKIAILDISGQAETKIFRSPVGRIRKFELHPKGNILAAIGPEGKVCVFNVRNVPFATIQS